MKIIKYKNNIFYLFTPTFFDCLLFDCFSYDSDFVISFYK